jgi:hypothetical protein
MKPDMVKALPPQDASVEPTPKFPSAAEIELAEQLRHQLEERYLEASAAPPSPQNRSGESH